MTVRQLHATDVDAADRICRVAFGTFLGQPEPERFFGDADFVRTRWKANPQGALAANVDGRLAGSNFVANWGSVGFFGPLTVDPELWGRGVAQRLLDATMALFDTWGTRHAGLFTFAQSAKHVGLYQKYGFWPRYLTAVMFLAIEQPDPAWNHVGATRLSTLSPADQASAIRESQQLTDDVYAGLDLSQEIIAVEQQQLGDTLLLHDRGRAQALAVCHIGAGTEAGSGNCFVKFGAVRPGRGAPARFERLVDACLALAAERGAGALVAGANAGRDHAWRLLAQRGFRREFQGVAMHRPNEPGYSTSNAYVIDDWR